MQIYSLLTMLRSNKRDNAKKGTRGSNSSSSNQQIEESHVSNLIKTSEIRLTRLNLDPKVLSESRHDLATHGPVDFDYDDEDDYDDGEDDDDDYDGGGDGDDDDEEGDEVHELPEVEKQQMEQLTSFVDAAYSTSTKVLNSSGGSLAQLQLSRLGQLGQDMTIGSSLPMVGLTNIAPSPISSHTPLLQSSTQSSAESHSTHTSDFHTSYSNEDGEQYLEKMKGTPNTLEKALSINQALQRRITINIARLEETVKQNLRRQLTLHNEEDEERLVAEEEKHLRISDSRYFLRISSFCQPYFKTKGGMPAPMNEDAVFKIKSGFLDMYQTKQRPWNKKEMRAIADAALSDARDVQLQQLRKKQGDLRRSLKALPPTEQASCTDLEDQIAECDRDAAALNRLPLRLVPVPKGIQLDWLKIEAQATNGYRTPDECQYLWETQLSPNISTKDFSAKDDIAIQTAVKRYKKQKPDWAAIADQLSEPRSQFQVFRRYQSFIAPALNPSQWNNESQARLVELVEELRIGDFVPWAQVHQQMPGFSRSQLQGQWKKLNPNRKKGPFTGKEDYTFLKGLHRFGLNYSQILKFLPHRNKNQVKDRFKRTIVPGFLTQWTSEMDRELRHLVATNASDSSRLNASFWRRLVSVDVFAKSGKDAGMLRLRYLILKLWSEVSRTDESPPPLFPVSITTSPEDITELNTHFLNSDVHDQRTMLDKINAGNHIKQALRELDQRRHRLHLEHDQNKKPSIKRENPTRLPRLNHIHLHYLHQQATLASASGHEKAPIDLRILSYRRPTELSWPEQLLLDFFMPSKLRRVRSVNLETDIAAIGSIQRLMVGLQVRPLPVQPSEVEVLSRVGIRETEMAIINSMVNRHSCGHKHEYASDAPCLWCSGDAIPECLPLLPPSLTTVTALQSLLLHRPSLTAMAQGKFVLHKFTGTDVRQLGDKPRNVLALSDPRKAYESGDLPKPGMVGKVHITSVMEQMKKKKLSVTERLTIRNKQRRTLNNVQQKKPRWTKRSIISIYKSFKMGKLPSQYHGAKKTEGEQVTDEPEAVSGGPSTCQAASGPVKQEVAPVTAGKKKVAAARKRGRPKRESTRPTPVMEPVASDHSNDEGSPAEEVSDEESEDIGLSAEELQARAEGDNLLWHRFLSVFLWPAMMTLIRPSPHQVQHVEEQFNMVDSSKQPQCPKKEQNGEREAPTEQLSDAVQRILEEVKPKQRRPNKRSRDKDEEEKQEPGVQIKWGKVVPPPSRASTRQKKIKLELDTSQPQQTPSETCQQLLESP